MIDKSKVLTDVYDSTDTTQVSILPFLNCSQDFERTIQPHRKPHNQSKNKTWENGEALRKHLVEDFDLRQNQKKGRNRHTRISEESQQSHYTEDLILSCVPEDMLQTKFYKEARNQQNQDRIIQ